MRMFGKVFHKSLYWPLGKCPGIVTPPGSSSKTISLLGYALNPTDYNMLRSVTHCLQIVTLYRINKLEIAFYLFVGVYGFKARPDIAKWHDFKPVLD
jgi:hypothetical protein